MSIVFTGSELIEIALDIERNGVAFYQALAELRIRIPRLSMIIWLTRKGNI